MVTTLYFGGWQVPYLNTATLTAHASTVLKVLLLTGVVVFLVGGVLSVRYDRYLAGTWPKGDLRNQEGKILATIAFVLVVIQLAALVFFWSMDLPDWGRAVVTLLAQLSAFGAKLLFFCWMFIWVRWTLPRFRYDQIMRLGWKSLIPLAFANIFITGFILLLIDHFKS